MSRVNVEFIGHGSGERGKGAMNSFAPPVTASSGRNIDGITRPATLIPDNTRQLSRQVSLKPTSAEFERPEDQSLLLKSDWEAELQMRSFISYSSDSDNYEGHKKQNYLLACHMLLFAGFLATFTILGFQLNGWLFLIYLVIFAATRSGSNHAFGCSIITLAMIPVMVLTGREMLAEGYAFFSFLLLSLGAVAVVVELSSKNYESKGFHR